MKRTFQWMLTVGLVLGVVVSSGWANEETPHASGQDRVDEMMGRYNLQPAFEKLGRGLSNALFGWLELPLNIDQRYSTSDVIGSSLTGATVGTFKGAVRMGVGVYETVTFFLPYPEHFAPILPTLEYFKKNTRRKPLPLE